MTDTDIPQRLSAVRDRAARAALAAGRNPADVRLIAVSKNFPVDSVRAAASAGQVDFGENRVQEGLEKIAAGPAGLEWHLIGHLQTNKARKAAAAFRWIHSIDSVDLLLKVDRAAADAGKTPSVLIQVDLAGEATKSGAKPEAVPAIVDAARGCASARLVGLMLMPPFFDDPEDTRAYFRRLRAMRDDLVARDVPPAMLAHLSMGMSHDFEVAIQEGATIVRVGTAIFGERDYQ